MKVGTSLRKGPSTWNPQTTSAKVAQRNVNILEDPGIGNLRREVGRETHRAPGLMCSLSFLKVGMYMEGL